MLAVLIKKATWTQDEKTAQHAVARQDFFRQSWDINPAYPANDLHIDCLLAQGKHRFIAQHHVIKHGWDSPADNDWPFYFRKIKDKVEIHFNTHFEGTLWRPRRFTRQQKDEQAEQIATTTWYRSSCLFSLNPGQSASHKINYYHGNRSLAGASIASAYLQFEAYFVYMSDLEAKVFAREYDHERNELVNLR